MRPIDADALKKMLSDEAVIKAAENVLSSPYQAEFEYFDIEEYIDNTPTIVPSADIKSCGVSADKSTEQNVADVPSGDTISRANVLALINKAMNNTDNKDIQDYIFCGLRRDVHNLSSIDRPRGEWLDEYGDKVEIDDNGITEDSCWCSVCGEWLVASDEYPTKGNFCPNCGADMRGEK